MSDLFVSPILQRTLSAVYRFYDAFFFPIDDRTPPVTTELDVSIPKLRWSALRAEDDSTYRFSAITLTQPAPSGANLDVQVVAANGEYSSFEPIALTLPLPLSVPPLRSDFLIRRPLWPTSRLRPADGETAVRGQVHHATLPVASLKVEMWLGPAPVPPAGTPYTRTSATGEFLFRFPLLKGSSGSAVSMRIRLDAGAVAVLPSSLAVVLGRTQIIPFQRT